MAPIENRSAAYLRQVSTGSVERRPLQAALALQAALDVHAALGQ